MTLGKNITDVIQLKNQYTGIPLLIIVYTTSWNLFNVTETMAIQKEG